MDQIQLIGVKELDDMELDAVNRLSARYYPKLQKFVEGEMAVSVHIKKHNATGRQCKYAVHVKAKAPGNHFFSTKGVDWDINKALHMAFKDVLHMIEHKLKINREKKTPRV